MTIVKKIMWVMLMLSGIIIMVVSSAVFNVAPSFRERTMAWIMENIFAILSLIMITFAVIFLGIDFYKSNNLEFKSADDEVKLFIKKEYRPTVWTRFKNYINPIRKMNQYQEVLRVELHNLEQTAKEEDMMLFDKTDDDSIELKKKNLYCQKRTFLEARTEEEWIKQNIRYIKVDYDEIDINVIVSGYFPKKVKGVRQVNEYVTKDKTWKLIKSRTPMIVLITGIFMFISSMIMDFQFGATFWANTGIKVMSMTWNIFIAIRFTDEWNNTVILTDAMFQSGIVKEYRNFVKRELKAMGNTGGEEDVTNT